MHKHTNVLGLEVVRVKSLGLSEKLSGLHGLRGPRASTDDSVLDVAMVEFRLSKM